MTARLLQSSDDESPSFCISSFYTVLCIAGMQCSLLFLPQPPLPSPTPHSDLSTHTALLDVVIGAFSSPTEEIRAAASYALGSVSAGNECSRRQYLLLHSFKEGREGRVERGEGDGRRGREGEGRSSAV